MIPIKHKKIREAVDKHVLAVIEYTQNRARKRSIYSDINNWINTIFYNHFNRNTSFSDILRLNYEEINELVYYFDQNWSGQFPHYIEYIRNNLYKAVFQDKETGFSFKNEQYSAYHLILDLGITVCPYCNRNFIFNSTKKRTSHFDHFFPESKYPFLAMSFYNLVPSCSTCNTLKGKESIDYNPYSKQINISDKRFNLVIKGPSFYYEEKDLDIELLRNNLEKT
jgi:5-methylcytosine-specific restriction endonuclease McrA